MFVVPVVITLVVGWLLVSRWATVRVRTAGAGDGSLGRLGRLSRRAANDRGGWSAMRWRWSLTAEQKLLAQRARSAKAATGRVASAGSLSVSDRRLAGVSRAEPRQPGDRRADSKPIGRTIRPSCCGNTPSGRAGRHSRSSATFASRRSSAARKNRPFATDLTTGPKFGRTATPPDSADPATGAGPRGVPTFHEGKIYTVGATGLVDCLDAATGQLIWQRNLLKDVDTPLAAMGHRHLAAGRRRAGHRVCRRRRWQGNDRLCRGDRRAGLDRRPRNAQLQLAATGPARWSRADFDGPRSGARRARSRLGQTAVAIRLEPGGKRPDAAALRAWETIGSCWPAATTRGRGC